MCSTEVDGVCALRSTKSDGGCSLAGRAETGLSQGAQVGLSGRQFRAQRMVRFPVLAVVPVQTIAVPNPEAQGVAPEQYEVIGEKVTAYADLATRRAMR